jgi:hypothetical protein
VHKDIWRGKPERKNHLEDLDLDQKIILKWSLRCEESHALVCSG